MSKGPARRRPRRVKGLLMALMIGSSAALVAVFVGYRYLTGGAGDAGLALPGSASLVLSRIHQTATRNGILEWELDAAGVRYIDASEEAVFESPSVTFFTDDSEKVTLTADRGTLHTSSKNLRVTDNVTMGYARYTLETKALYYDHGKRMIFADSPVNLSGSAFSIRADTMAFDLATNQTVFRGHIEGTLSETL